MIASFTYNSPWAFYFFAILFFIVCYSYLFTRNGTFFYSDLKLLSKQANSLRSQMVFLPKALKVIALVLVVMALARPQTTQQLSRESQEGLDIMIVMDISFSMLVQDMGYNITRLSASKEVVKNFIEERSYDRIGLIVFSGESFTKNPLTYDHQLLKKNLSEVQTLSSIKPGTAIGVALANSVARLKSSPKKSRIIIFLTDGENNTGFIDPETALDLVKKNNIKVYTVGLGTRSGVFSIQFKDTDKMGRTVYRTAKIESHINRELMEKISKQTSGKFFMANNLKVLEQTFNQINQLETYEIKTDSWTLYQEYFESYLWPAFVIYFLSVLLSLSVFFRGI